MVRTFRTLLAATLMCSLAGSIQPQEAPPIVEPTYFVLAQDALADNVVESTDIRLLDVRLLPPSWLELRILTVGDVARASPGLTQTYRFTEYVELAQWPRPEGTVVVQLEATGSAAMETEWTFTGAAARTASRTWDTEHLDWRPLTVDGGVAGKAVSWRLDLEHLASLFPKDLPIHSSWELTRPFAQTRFLADPIVEATLQWTLSSAHAFLASDRAPNRDTGQPYWIPALQPGLRTPGAAGSTATLIEDAVDDAWLEALDLRRVRAFLEPQDVLGLALETQQPLPRGTYSQLSPNFEFSMAFQLEPVGPASGTGGAVTVRLGGVARTTFGATVWTWSAEAAEGTVASHRDVEDQYGGGAGWTTITATASVVGRLITWRVDLSHLATLFSSQLPRNEPWVLSQAFADSRLGADGVVEGTLMWVADGPHDSARRDRAPNRGYGTHLPLPAQEESQTERGNDPQTPPGTGGASPQTPTPAPDGRDSRASRPSTASAEPPQVSGVALPGTLLILAVASAVAAVVARRRR